MNTLIKNGRIVNEGIILEGDILIKGDRIEKISGEIEAKDGYSIIDAKGSIVMPGAIDDQVHFREPGLTHKANIYAESRAAIAGGITSFMEMPNTKPPALTQELLQQKYDIASNDALANYSFFMGVSNENSEEVLKTDPKNVCGIKIFMGSSTGSMLVDDEKTLETLFSKADMLIATHCEDEATIRRNTEAYRKKYGESMPFSYHPEIRSEEACYLSSSHAVEIARRHNTKLHILHISTGKETSLFDNSIPLAQKRITSEACIHHMWFTREDYDLKGSLIKWNPAVKEVSDRDKIIEAVNSDLIDVIATDHAPHTLEEKQNTYFQAPSGGPLVQHSIMAMLDLVKQGKFSLEKIVEKMCHNPAILFQINERGYLREGYYADIVIVDDNAPFTVNKNNILAKCQWSPFEGHTFPASISHTFVNGNLVFEDGEIRDVAPGRRLKFDR